MSWGWAMAVDDADIQRVYRWAKEKEVAVLNHKPTTVLRLSTR